MTKQDLKTGMLVQTRDKEIGLIVEEVLLFSRETKNEFEWINLQNYRDNLCMQTNHSEFDFDIIKVTKVLTGYALCHWTEEVIDKHLLWSREGDKVVDKPLRKEQFDIESNTWTETN